MAQGYHDKDPEQALLNRRSGADTVKGFATEPHPIGESLAWQRANTVKVITLFIRPTALAGSSASRRSKSPTSLWNDRKSVVQGKRVSVRVDLGGRRSIKIKKT